MRMARKGLKPVSIEGIEFDALIDETKTLSATIPVYPVENGFPVSDTIILDPISIQMTLYVSNTPVTWLYRHGTSNNRVKQICEQIEALWFRKELVKIVTTDAIYKDMGITSLTIKKSREIGYAREISLSAQKVRVTEKEIVDIPDYSLKSGSTQANAGVASTSATSISAASYQSAVTEEEKLGKSMNSTNTEKSGTGSLAKKNQSILYGVASGLHLI